MQFITSKGIPLNRRFETKRHEGLKRINSNKAKKGQYKDVQKNQRKPNFAHVEKLKIYTSVLDFILLSQLIQDTFYKSVVEISKFNLYSKGQYN